jgi:hypothetical protein
VDESEIQHLLDEVSDQAVMYHAFVDYMRDYEVIVYRKTDPRSGIPTVYLRYLFKTCVQATVETALAPSTWATSLDERLVESRTGKGLDGYVWGVRWQELYPGGRVVSESPKATEWSAALGLAFHEVELKTNAHRISLIFSELEATEIDESYRPFTLEPTGWSDGKHYLD